MRKNPFWYFWFDRLWPFNFEFGCQPKSSNHNILVFAHLIWKLKIVLKRYRWRESKVRNPFWYFKCFTFGNPCDSWTSPGATFWPVTSEKFLRHGFLVFNLNHPFYFESWSGWHFGWLIWKTLHSASNGHLELMLKNFLSHEEELVFEKIPSVESILRQLFIQF